MSKIPCLALVGHPNSGKTSLFNLLTGLKQRVGNYPGITVERKKGKVTNSQTGETIFELIDLPGLYTLDAYTSDERITRDILLGRGVKRESIDLVLLVLDSTNLEKGLYLYNELKHLSYPMIVIFNLFDLSQKRGLKLDWQKVKTLMKHPVVVMSAARGEGEEELRKLVLCELQKLQNIPLQASPPNVLDKFLQNDFIHQNYKEVKSFLKEVTLNPLRADSLTQKVDAVLLHPLWGHVALLLVLLFIFQGLFTWTEPIKDLLESSLGSLQESLGKLLPEGLIRSFFIDGIMAGVGNTLVFLPQILFLFFIVTFLEDVGYLGRAAYLMDHLMRKLGLPGKAMVPLISSHACAIPGIMSVRTLENEKDRLVTMLVSPLVTCSARIPVYTMLIAAFVPNETFFGPIRYPGLVMLALYLFGIFISLVMAFLLKKTILRGGANHLLMELPPYRFPQMKNILQQILQKAEVFLKRAGTVILGLSIVIWFLVTFPRVPGEKGLESNLDHSYAAKLGHILTPIFKPIGFDWRITTALIPSFGAREIVVSSMATVLSVQQSAKKVDIEDVSFKESFTNVLRKEYSVSTLMALLVWFVFSPQCISTFAILRKESNSWKWPLFMGSYTLALAYLGSFIAYRIF